MKQYSIILLCLLFALCSVQCRTVPKQTVSYQMLTGEWHCVRIAYKDVPEGKTELVKIYFYPGRKFRFIWEETVFSGKYKIDSDELIFLGAKKDDFTICTYRIKQNNLILEMNDGFIFELQKE